MAAGEERALTGVLCIILLGVWSAAKGSARTSAWGLLITGKKSHQQPSGLAVVEKWLFLGCSVGSYHFMCSGIAVA